VVSDWCLPLADTLASRSSPTDRTSRAEGQSLRLLASAGAAADGPVSGLKTHDRHRTTPSHAMRDETILARGRAARTLPMARHARPLATARAVAAQQCARGARATSRQAGLGPWPWEGLSQPQLAGMADGRWQAGQPDAWLLGLRNRTRILIASSRQQQASAAEVFGLRPLCAPGDEHGTPGQLAQHMPLSRPRTERGGGLYLAPCGGIATCAGGGGTRERCRVRG
jgi:hypothetical protein